MSAFVVSNIAPSLKVDASQRFVLGWEELPEPLGKISVDNIFVPTSLAPSVTKNQIRNNTLSGYRWIHETAEGETYGSYTLQKFLADSSTGIDLMVFNDDGSFSIPGTTDAKFIVQTADPDVPNAQSLGALTTGLLKNTVTTGTGVLSTAVVNTDYYAPGSVPTAVNGGDAINKTFVDSITALPYIVKTASALIPNAQALGALSTGLLKNTTSTGVLTIAVSGTDYATLAHRLDQFANPNTSLNFNNQKGINALDPTNPQDLATKAYVDLVGVNVANAKFIIQTSDPDLPNAQILGSLASGILKNTTTTGLLSVATAGTDYYSPNNPTIIRDTDITSFNVSVGKQALASFTTADNTTAVGYQALNSVTTGDTNTAFGSLALKAINTGGGNIGIGHDAASLTTTGNGNIALGTCLGLNTNGNFNIAIGNSALGLLSIGSQNVSVGVASAVNQLTYNNCLFLGHAADASVNGLTNAIAIGYQSSVATSNSMVLGSGVNVGIGTSSPTQAKFVISGGVANVASEDTCIRVTGTSNATKIELERTGGSGKLYELRSDNAGAFSLFDRTAVAVRFTFDTNGIFNLTNNSIINSGSSSAVPVYQVGNSTDYIQMGYDGANDYSFFNLVGSSNDRCAIRFGGTGVAAVTSTGLWGFGTVSPTLAKLHVVGGVTNVGSEESGIRVVSSSPSAKIELQCTNGSGKLFELHSDSNGGFNFYDRTSNVSRMYMNSSGVGFGNIFVPHAQIHLPNVLTNRQMVFWEGANNNFQFHGFGSVTGGFGYNIVATTDSHIWYAGVNSSSRNEVGRLSGVGDLTIADTIFGKRPTGVAYMQGNATVTTVTAGNWGKVAGTTTSDSLNKCTMPANNRIQYTGTPTVRAYIIASVTAYHNVALGSILGFSIFKNGVQVVPSAAYVQTALNIVGNVCVMTIVSLATNDYVEVYGTSSANADITVSNLTFDLTTT